MHVSQQKTQSAHRAARLRFALQMAEQSQRVGRRIAELREGREWSRPDLARRLPGLSTGNDVYRWEKGDHLPRSDTLEAIADVFGVDIADLYAGPIAERKQKGDNGASPIDQAEAELRATSPASAEDVARLEKSLQSVADQVAELGGLLAEVGATQEQLRPLLPRLAEFLEANSN